MFFFFFSSRRRHTSCALVTGVQTCALPISVLTVAAPIARDVTLWDEYIGRFEASKAVEVRPRVSGAITAIHFTDGQVVRKGQPLFTIEPRPYRAALAEARASAASARSDLALAKLELDRASRLVRSEEHTSELQSLMRPSSAVYFLKQTTHLTD